MKMVKSLLLGSAAGILAVAGAQAADLPVKAKPVEYVKVCALYGAGFYYIPGTDTCLKVGGFVRVDYAVNAGGSHGQYFNQVNGSYNRYTDDFRTRTRWNITLDARSQTEYGTLRSYIRAGMQYTTDDAKDGVIYYDRAFIQLGGFTFGKTLSFLDAFGGGAHSYATLYGASDTGNGVTLAAYTAQFGNGFSGTISLEDSNYANRQTGLLAADGATVDLPTAPGLTNAAAVYGGNQMPNIVGNLRVDQAWGSAQLGAVIHQVRAHYYNIGGTFLEGNGAPDDDYGFGVVGGVQINLPWAAGDKVTFQGSYGKGFNYAAYADIAQSVGLFSGTTVFEGLNYDSVYNAGGDHELTEVWGFNAGIEHYWTPSLRSSLFGAYIAVDYNANATALICATGSYRLNPAAAAGTCNPDWTAWSVGTRTVWNPVRNLDVGLELLYTKFENDHENIQRLATGAAGKPGIWYDLTDQEVFSGMVRVQRNFWP